MNQCIQEKCGFFLTTIIIFTEFHGIDMWMLKKALTSLEEKGKAQMFEAPDSTDESGLGVKFYS